MDESLGDMQCDIIGNVLWYLWSCPFVPVNSLYGIKTEYAHANNIQTTKLLWCSTFKRKSWSIRLEFSKRLSAWQLSTGKFTILGVPKVRSEEVCELIKLFLFFPKPRRFFPFHQAPSASAPAPRFHALNNLFCFNFAQLLVIHLPTITMKRNLAGPGLSSLRTKSSRLKPGATRFKSSAHHPSSPIALIWQKVVIWRPSLQGPTRAARCLFWYCLFCFFFFVVCTSPFFSPIFRHVLHETKILF